MYNWPDAAERQPVEVHTDDTEKLVGLHSEVEPDGEAAICSVAFTNQPAFKVSVSLAQAGFLLNEIRHAASLMINRQRFRADRGDATLLEIANAAIRPADIQILADPLSGDRVVVLQFEQCSPIAYRLAPDQVFEALAKLQMASRAAAN